MNKKIFIGGLSIFSVFVLSLCLILDKGSLAVEELIDRVTIDCPETAATAGDEITCSIDMEVNTIEAQGINANYKVDEGMSFVSFTPGTGWTDYSFGSDTGFVVVNADTISSISNIGTLKYKMPLDAKSDEVYKIELTNITIGDGDVKTVEIDNVFDEVRMVSYVNTLDEIQLSSGTLDKEFDKSVKEYNAKVDVDKIVIGAIKTNEYSTLGGDIGEVDLHYGTNTFNIIVTSEAGFKNTYKLNFF